MRSRFLIASFAALVVAGLAALASADDYMVDPIHSSVSFQVSHLGLSSVHGRFNAFSGAFTLDPSDPTKASFTLKIKPESIDTNNTKRDNHLRTSDFFDVKQFPDFSFKSTSVKPIEGGYEVTGDLTLHGTSKPVTFSLKGGRSAEMKGQRRTGFTTQLVLKRSDFGMDKFVQMLSDQVTVEIGLEGVRR
jgi:polyisoprenoid-binding protein YceI